MPSTFSHIKPMFPLHQTILGTDTRQLITTLIAQSLLELFKLANPELWSKCSTLAPLSSSFCHHRDCPDDSVWHAATPVLGL